ncbi:group II intron reverse transcriptase/maturase [Cytobacillus oceanisediminis]|uniref:Group II intron reverse transcriptase/maturase n=2 Tax=Cytobacillus TaxID=2675230 RepID=A0ABX3CK81_9BACI|nr:group II intron reverse transcriptase/maturase [Cytobacillus oceanisediminis]OHX41385.1 group II intron reverse transcriptase/maturase [Cytobacillus oceanisediminis]
MSTKARAKQYYSFDEIQQTLYRESKENKVFKNLMQIILSDENILLAYRTIKTNKGSITSGTDKENILNLAEINQEEFLNKIRISLSNYKPKSVRRVYIPKANGKLRPLGIPTITDRLIQQMFKQVLEPICEAKFFNHSYGFRPLRSTKHAISRIQTLININKLNFTVDIDIKGFFDNVNHNLLIKQLWNIGIRDKRVLAIIGKMLKAPIKGEGIPNKGVPQGGILSPLLSNVVLNNLDQWVAGQWETFETKHKYSGNDVKIFNLKRTSKLKEGYIVRYADDFRIMTRNHDTAIKWFHAVKSYLKNRLKLDISEEKSKVINLRKKSSTYLGYKIKAVRKKNKWVAKTNVSDDKMKQMQGTLKDRINAFKKQLSPENVNLYNATVLGMQQYFQHATHVRIDFHNLEYKLKTKLYNTLWNKAKYEVPKIENISKSTYLRIYGSNNKRTYVFKSGAYLYPIGKVKTKNSKNFSQGRNPFEVKQGFSWDKEITRLMMSRLPDSSIEYTDNRLSRYSMQKGLCAITKSPLTAELVHCHHVLPKALGGKDTYDNLLIIHMDIHTLIHATNSETIDKYISLFSLNSKQVEKVNRLRAKCKLERIC